ncbi:MAG: hypothetical protein JW958_12810 [Candidatus Eisenbacteria bacterium]|nr:hypothetical protein [Candidatus Eisenbacteria bacterium]
MPFIVFHRREGLRTAAVAAVVALLFALPAADASEPEPRLVAEGGGRADRAAILSWEGTAAVPIDGTAPVRYSVWRRAGADEAAGETDPETASRLSALYGEDFAASMLAGGWLFFDELPARSVESYAVATPWSDGADGEGGVWPEIRVFAHAAADSLDPGAPPVPPDTTDAPADSLDPGAPPDSAPPPPFPSAAVESPPSAPALLPVLPNPFNPKVTVRFLLPESLPVLLAVYDTRGRLVAILADEFFDGGEREVVWDGRGDSGRAAPSGIYLIRLEAGGVHATGRAVLLR